VCCGAALAGVLSRVCGAHTRHAKVEGGDPGEPAGLGPLLAEEGEGEIDAFDFTEPAFALCSLAAGQEIAFDLVEAGSIFGLMLIMGHLRQA
jgi:hypothetical protein